MRVVLGGGGSAGDEAPILDAFAKLVGADGRVLYLPIAARDAESNPERYVSWIESVLPPRKLCVAGIWSSLRGHSPEEVFSFDALFLGGGNTFELLQKLRTTGFADSLAAFSQFDRVLYGGSAGAIVLGRDIAGCTFYDSNVIGLTDTRGSIFAAAAVCGAISSRSASLLSPSTSSSQGRVSLYWARALVRW
jgi:dipeptidase E